MGKITKNVTKFKGRHPGYFWGLAIVGIFIIIIIIFQIFGLFSQWLPAETTTFQVLDPANNNADVTEDARITVWRKEITGDEDETFDYSDYKTPWKERGPADEVSFTIDTDYSYKVLVEYEGSKEWIQYVEEGVNTVNLCDKTETLNHVAFDDEMNTTIAYTDNTDWTITVSTDDGEGIIPFYDFESDENYYVVFNITFASSASSGYADIDDISLEHTLNNSLYLYSSAEIYGDRDFTLTFDDSVGSTFNVLSLDVGFGNLDIGIDFM
ncbi:MAG: hypothetical protein ACFFDN_29180 [Candidatus Hodarchaeota archaeon]